MLGEKELARFQELSEGLVKSGFAGIRYQVNHTVTRVTGVRRKSVVKMQDSSDKMYVIEASMNGNCGRIHCSKIPPLEIVIDQLKETAEILGKKQRVAQYSVKEFKKQPTFLWESHAHAGECLLHAEKTAYRYPETDLVETCLFEQKNVEIYLLNESGVCLQDSTGYHCMKGAVIVRKNGQTEYAHACCYGNCLKEFDGCALMREIAEEAIGNLSGNIITSGSYEVILKNNVMAEILEAYLPAFYADKLRNHLSGLSGQMGKMIAAAAVILEEQPESQYGRCTRVIDDEGAEVSKKYLIDRGRFQTALSNQKAALEMQTESTGNGFKSSMESDVEIGVTNIILKSAETISATTEEITNQMGSGLLVTRVDGVFAGIDIKSGGFSLIAQGRMIKDGKVAGGFREVTIAGNFYRMLAQIKRIGVDNRAISPDCACVIAPTVWVGALAVSGN